MLFSSAAGFGPLKKRKIGLTTKRAFYCNFIPFSSDFWGFFCSSVSSSCIGDNWRINLSIRNDGEWERARVIGPSVGEVPGDLGTLPLLFCEAISFGVRGGTADADTDFLAERLGVTARVSFDAGVLITVNITDKRYKRLNKPGHYPISDIYLSRVTSVSLFAQASPHPALETVYMVTERLFVFYH